MTASITFDFNNMLASRVGPRGLEDQALAQAAQSVPGLHQALKDKRPAQAWRELPYQDRELLDKLQATGQHIRENFDYFVVLGIGGSALGSKALLAACGPAYYEQLLQKQGCRLLVEDNVDPDRLTSLLRSIDVKRAAFHIISKSGSTVETMSQFLIVAALLHQQLGEEYQKNIFLTTDAKAGVLRPLAERLGWEAFVVPEGVGGRFSVLCPVGLLTAAVAGLDIRQMLAGAAAMDQACSQPGLQDNPAYMYALLHVLALRQGINISVLMPYADALAPTAEWYCQLWAESLGKRFDVEGREICCGQTPVRALGVTDQHSQIQLYTEGPFDKVITFLGLHKFKQEIKVPQAPFDLPQLAYLYGHSLNELIRAEREATVFAVSRAGKPNCSIMLEELNEFSFGALLYFFEVATAAAGELLHIDAFDQPGVEEGKKATYALMGREGYEDEAAELRAAGEGDAALIFRV